MENKITKVIREFFNIPAKKVEKKLTKYGNPQQAYSITIKEWSDKIDEYGLPRAHPSYNEDEEYVMRFRGARGLRFASSDIEDKAPHYLVMREAMRRYLKGMSTRHNNYPKLVVRAFERMQDELLDENSKELGDTFRARPGSDGSGYMQFEGKRQFGEMNERGEFWSPGFRKWYPHEEFIVIGRIDRLYTEWGQGTYKMGKKQGVDIGALRRKLKADGTAQALIEKHNLPVDKFLNKLISSFKPRKTKS